MLLSKIIEKIGWKTDDFIIIMIYDILDDICKNIYFKLYKKLKRISDVENDISSKLFFLIVFIDEFKSLGLINTEVFFKDFPAITEVPYISFN